MPLIPPRQNELAVPRLLLLMTEDTSRMLNDSLLFDPQQGRVGRAQYAHIEKPKTAQTILSHPKSSMS